MDKVFVPFTRYTKVSLNEAPQYKQVNFVSVYEKDNQLIGMHPPALCRDYLGDVLYCNKLKKSNATIYGLDYQRNKDGELQFDRTKLILTFNPKTKDKETLFKNINILWELEKQCKLKTTELTELDDNTVYVRGSKRWLDNNFVYSFYTFMLRALCYNQITNQKLWYEQIAKYGRSAYTATEGQYINQISLPRFEVLLKNLKKFFIPLENSTGYESPNLNIMTVHSSSGFLNITLSAGYIMKENKLIKMANKILFDGKEVPDADINDDDDDYEDDDDPSDWQ